MFIDSVKINVKAGKGGNGIVAYRREPYVEMGGPYGGNGGKGGSIVFMGDENLSTLIDFKFQKNIVGKDGTNGGTKGMVGACAEDTIIKVPLGTQIFVLPDDTFLGEIVSNKQIILVASGGKGGRGNMAFASNKNKCPEFAEKGDNGESFDLRLELKVLADIGLVGFPSVGKSSIINALTNAKSKVAAYPFTTLHPYLGVTNYYGNTFVVADLPGLIKNASLGEGLGFQFLKHVERCKVFAHVIDATSINPLQDYKDIVKELKLFNPLLLNKSEIIIINKIDEVTAPDLKKIQNKFKTKKVISVSALYGTNIDSLVKTMYEVLSSAPSIELVPKEIVSRTNIILNNIEVIKEDGIFYVIGDKVSQFFNRTDFNNEESIKRFLQQVKSIGVEDELKKNDIKDKDTVNIYGFSFEYLDDLEN
ncbi:MAG: GTPase ObgE [Acholeplasmatales bacterium]|jgi:GTP-binding protein|nr:GTPase ObgE [Acholeplasmatales bacterium]